MRNNSSVLIATLAQATSFYTKEAVVVWLESHKEPFYIFSCALVQVVVQDIVSLSENPFCIGKISENP